MSLGPIAAWGQEGGAGDAATEAVAAVADGVSDALSDNDAAPTAVEVGGSNEVTEKIPNPVIFSAGEHLLGAAIGLTFPTSLSTARAMLDLSLEYQYFLPYNISLGAGINYGCGFARTGMFTINAGAHYHHPLPWPVALAFGLDFVGGGLFNVRHADLGYLGARISVGANYYLRTNKKKVAVGGAIVADIGSSISEINAAYAKIGLVFVFNYHIK